MKLQVLLATCLILMLPHFSKADDQRYIEQAVVVKAILADFYKTNIKNLKEEPDISIYSYADGETDKLLSSSEYEVVHRCSDKYNVKVIANGNKSLYIYCFDDKKAKMLLEKKLP